MDSTPNLSKLKLEQKIKRKARDPEIIELKKSKLRAKTMKGKRKSSKKSGEYFYLSICTCKR